MSVKKFRFVSPGIFINEIDNSQLPKEAGPIGPVIIGRTQRGPGMRPVQVNSFSEFVEIFGNPIPGGQGGDTWRNGNYTAPAYAGYAAQAWLRNATPCTVVRLLGTKHTDATSDGVAGWATADVHTNGGGAYGLFIAPHVETAYTNSSYLAAALAAVIYVDGEHDIGLVGEGADGAALVNGTNAFSTGKWCVSTGASYGFKIHIGGKTKVINFDRNSKNFIRNKLNTNSTLVNEAITNNTEKYFLGETYERHVEDLVTKNNPTSTNTGKSVAVLMALDSGSIATLDKNQMNIEAQAPESSWIFSQHTGLKTEHYINIDNGEYEQDVTNLFKFHGLSDGEWSSGNLKLSIADIKAGDDYSPYGTFTVTLRKTDDSDNSPRYVERFTGCNLNPNSSDYVARKVGDMYTLWDDEEKRYRTYGQYPNLSKFIRVEVAPDVDAASTPQDLVPFGFYGPAVPRPVRCSPAFGTAMAAGSLPDTLSPDTNPSATYIGVAFGSNIDTLVTGATASGDDQSPYFNDNSDNGSGDNTAPNIDLIWPAMPTRSTSSSGNLSSGKSAFFGATSNKSGATTEDEAYVDLVKPYSEGHPKGYILPSHTLPQLQSGGVYDDDTDGFRQAIVATATVRSTGRAAGDWTWKGIVHAFTLDDLVMQDSTLDGDTAKSLQHVDWKPGARYSGASISVRGRTSLDYYETTATAEGVEGVDAGDARTTPDEGTYKDVLDHGYDQFTLPLVGGFDGLDIKEKEPFRNTRLASGTPTNNYAYNSVKRAIDAVADPEVVEMSLAAIPGVTNDSLTTHLVNTCEARGDSLAVIDLEEDYVPNTENTTVESSRVPSVDLAVAALKTRGLNSSYGCAYFPWVQIKDTISDSVLWSPPSVVAIGTMASSQRKSELWFAPAGFNRGGLTEGSAGVPVLQARRRLTSKDRDKLYEANINPIATFPSEGLVIFGQKTLQVTPSALDRINVRRLLIFLKKEISTISAGILFDNNVPATWQRFTSQVEPLLASVKSRFGLSDFKVILDETTTTPDLIDRNILYAKIMLKPARSIEFIAIDFVISRTGASFDD